MNIHEYQAKELLKLFGIEIPEFAVVNDPEEIEPTLTRLGWTEGVVKAQVHAGGRGKAGGVKVAKTKEELIQAAQEILGMRLVTKQTGSAGKPVRQVMITPLVEVQDEYYLALLVDRKEAKVTLIVSPEGGVDIEEVAEKRPQAILKVIIPESGVLRSDHLWNIAKFMGWEGELRKEAFKLIPKLVSAFLKSDADLLEVNPLVKVNDSELVVLDAKVSVDDNALYRQEQLEKCFDPSQYTPQEVRAKASDLSYIALEGTIGCMVNGAGLAMATMDIIQYYGGKPANFLDVGGSATEDKIAEGFSLLQSDPNVQAILVNIFGGIMNCATIAKGIISSLRNQELKVPLVVRMEGTNVEEGRRLLKESGLPILSAHNLADAAQKAVEESKKMTATV